MGKQYCSILLKMGSIKTLRFKKRLAELTNRTDHYQTGSDLGLEILLDIISCPSQCRRRSDKMAPAVDTLVAMTDAFEGIDRLAEGAPKTDGAPNFRRLPGFPIFGTGQTSVDGFEKCLEPVLKKYGDEKHVFWVNLRQEPVVYVNGKPFTARDPNNINFHLEMNNPEDVTALENTFVEEIKKRGEDFKFFKDQFGEHPEERANNEEITEKLTGVTTLNEIYAAIKEKVPKFEPIRIPT